MTQTFTIRAGILPTGNNVVIAKEKQVEQPAVVFDRLTGQIFTIGNAPSVKHHHAHLQKMCHNAGYDMAADLLVYMELPKDQTEIDRVYHITGYVLDVYERTMQGETV